MWRSYKVDGFSSTNSMYYAFTTSISTLHEYYMKSPVILCVFLLPEATPYLARLTWITINTYQRSVHIEVQNPIDR